jgi:hypothetical protein
MIVNFVATQQARKWRKPERDTEVSGKSDACGITLFSVQRQSVFLICRKCSFGRIGLHFKAVFRRLSGAKSRETNAEMQFKAPKMHLGEFRNTL